MYKRQTEDKAREIVNAGVEEVTIRSVFTCNTRHGVCRHCYGNNLATGDAVEAVSYTHLTLPTKLEV
ncbi:hypothetical protein PVA38_11690 [Streptococcus pneumoniae D39]|nr:hypothetical protein PVA38_11690 [Streptococcus pneumoniae D39]